MEAVARDLRWKIALGLPVDHRGWSLSTLTRYRARLLLHRKERLALENILALAEELGMLDAPAEQIVDSTPTLGALGTGIREFGESISGSSQDDEHQHESRR